MMPHPGRSLSVPLENHRLDHRTRIERSDIVFYSTEVLSGFCARSIRWSSRGLIVSKLCSFLPGRSILTIKFRYLPAFLWGQTDAGYSDTQLQMRWKNWHHNPSKIQYPQLKRTPYCTKFGQKEITLLLATSMESSSATTLPSTPASTWPVIIGTLPFTIS